MRPYAYAFLIFASACLLACKQQLPKDVAEAYALLPKEIDYNIHVKPILSDKCFACHGPDKNKQKAGLRLDVPAVAFAELSEDPGKVAIAPGSLGGSEFFHRIISNDPHYKMPTPASHLALTANKFINNHHLDKTR